MKNKRIDSVILCIFDDGDILPFSTIAVCADYLCRRFPAYRYTPRMIWDAHLNNPDNEYSDCNVRIIKRDVIRGTINKDN